MYVRVVPRQPKYRNEMLSDDYEKLITYCKSDDFDPKMFKIMHDNYAKAFARLKYEQQGEVVAEIAEKSAPKYVWTRK